MLQIIFWFAVLIVCLVVLVKSADYFTRYSEKLGLALGLSSFIVGATIVAIGTSLPEFITSTLAVVHSGVTTFVADNIIGSNIANALLILGIGAVVAKTLKVKTSLIDVDLPFFFTSMALFTFFALDRTITRGEGLFLLGLFIIFLIYSVKPDTSKKEKEENKEELQDLKDEYADKKGKKGKKGNIPWGLYLFIILISAGALGISAKFLIDSVLNISELLGISSSMLTITVVAIGTSLPEVLTSIAAIRAGNHALAIGNVFGSNTFNLLLVGGFPALFADLGLTDVTFMVGLPFLIIATFVAFFVTLDDKIRLWEGAAMLFLYAVFIAKVTNLI
ncbi:MAG: calcium/sodium antiporter [Candidatus Kerfeldbacteria bacterium]